jgi:hypothetical protein
LQELQGDGNSFHTFPIGPEALVIFFSVDQTLLKLNEFIEASQIVPVLQY